MLLTVKRDSSFHFETLTNYVEILHILNAGHVLREVTAYVRPSSSTTMTNDILVSRRTSLNLKMKKLPSWGASLFLPLVNPPKNINWFPELDWMCGI
jgi:hypothetical protein